MPTAHRIRRLRWRVRAGSRDAAFEVRARLRRFHQENLLEVFERAFDATGVGDTVVHLSRLELAVTVPDIDGIAAALASALGRQTFSSESAPAPPARAIAADSRQSVTETATAGVDGLIEYLRTGVLPWPLANLGRTATRDELIRLAVDHRDRVAADIPLSIDDAVAYVFRWLQLTAPAEWVTIARLIDGPAAGFAESIAVLALIAAGSSPELPGVAPAKVAAAILAVAHVDRRAAPVTLRQLSVLFEPFVSIAVTESGERRLTMRAPGSDVVSAWIARRFEKARPEPAERPRSGAAETRSPTAHQAMPASPIRSIEEAAVIQTESPVRDTTPDDDRPGLVVDHAGLVVLHPFLPRLFERLGVAAPGTRAIDEALLPRAAALLAYAALGDDNALDFELGLIKVLLGLAPETVVLTPAGSLSAADRDEVDALLHSVIEHWQVLRHTSIAGLRGSFLQRRGLLNAVDGTWRLRVEPDSFDMLIDRLPWALGPIKLPWMNTLLFTEWARS